MIMKNLLVVYYSQTGQLKDIILNFTKPFEIIYHVDFAEIKCEKFVFPITCKQFFDVFPETVLKALCDIEVKIEGKSYDAIILGFQPWFLHTSIPFNSFIQTEQFKNLVKGKPVFLVMDSRNSWRNALHEVSTTVESYQGIIRGKYVFRDTSKNLRGFIALCYWLFTGKKKSSFMSIPQGGIEQEVINNAGLYGESALASLNLSDSIYSVIPSVSEEYTSLGYEQYAIAKYEKWANFISKDNFKHRKFRLALFRIWILFMLTFAAPVISRIKKKKRTASSNQLLKIH